MIEENVKALLAELAAGNGYGEPVTLVAATKTRTAEEICRAVGAGVTAVGENKVQEFREKFAFVRGAQHHFIGRLQTNKVKYLVGKADLIHSVDRDELAEAIAERAVKAGAVQDVLLEVNGGEASKGGYPLSEAEAAYKRLRSMAGLRIRGFMTMLPLLSDPVRDAAYCDEMRALFDRTKSRDENIAFLSMGMSGDWRLCVEHGSNMIRLGTAIFGERN